VCQVFFAKIFLNPAQKDQTGDHRQRNRFSMRAVAMFPATLRKALPQCYYVIVKILNWTSPYGSVKSAKRVRFMSLRLASFFGVLIGITAVLVVAGCSTTQPMMVNEWSNPGYNAPAFDRIMVGSAGEQDSIRRNLEDEFVVQLRTAGIHALPGYRYVMGDEKIDEVAFKEAAQRAGTDAAIIVRSINVEQKTNVAPAIYPSFGIFGPNVGATWSGFPGAPGVYRYKVYTSEVTLYDLKKNETVWTGTVRTTEPDNVNAAIKSYVGTVIKALNDKNLLGGKK
jgi:hypothetical protein